SFAFIVPTLNSLNYSLNLTYVVIVFRVRGIKSGNVEIGGKQAVFSARRWNGPCRHGRNRLRKTSEFFRNFRQLRPGSSGPRVLASSSTPSGDTANVSDASQG